jgi:LytS/YehU family sensor histidine kinase
VKDELKALQYYLDIEQLRFDNKFEYAIHLDKEIDDEFMGIPPMIMQPYVENAIHHGIINKKSTGHISISLKLENKIIFCVIEDDGVGRERAMQIKNDSGLKHKSRGMVITKERLEILNKQNKDQITVNVIDLLNDRGNPKGTKVEINIPYKDV